MHASEEAHTQEKIRQYTEELRKLEDEERSLLEKNGLDSQSAQAILEIPLSEEDAAKVQAGVTEKLQQIERDIAWRMAGNSNAQRPRNPSRRHQSRI